MKAETIARREQLKARAENLRRARGAALLEGKPFDDAKIRSVQSEVDALDDAEREATRRDAEEAANAALTRRTAARSRLAETETERLAAVGALEKAAREMGESLRRVLSLSADISAAARGLGFARPAVLDRGEVERRLSRYIASVLASPPTWSMGVLEWGSLPPTPDDWKEAERAVVAPHIADYDA